MNPKIQIKGIRDGLLILFGDGEWQDVHRALQDTLDIQGEFIRGARLALDVGNHTLKAAELGALRNELSEHGMTVWAVLSNSPTTEANAQSLGLATRLSKPGLTHDFQQVDTALHEGEPAILVRRTLRSGYSLSYPGHVIVIGDVNPGAEIIASGDIIVWGRLRGLVHAGAEGDENAIVAALDLSPTQLRVAGRIAVTPQRRGKVQAELARLQDGRVISEIWDGKKKTSL
jgi:septum site-determining protein MinC